MLINFILIVHLHSIPNEVNNMNFDRRITFFPFRIYSRYRYNIFKTIYFFFIECIIEVKKKKNTKRFGKVVFYIEKKNNVCTFTFTVYILGVL